MLFKKPICLRYFGVELFRPDAEHRAGSGLLFEWRTGVYSGRYAGDPRRTCDKYGIAY